MMGLFCASARGAVSFCFGGEPWERGLIVITIVIFGFLRRVVVQSG